MALDSTSKKGIEIIEHCDCGDWGFRAFERGGKIEREQCEWCHTNPKCEFYRENIASSEPEPEPR